MSIDALDPNDSAVFVNEDSIAFFDGSASGDTGLINTGGIQSGQPNQVTGISALENSGAIIGEGTLVFPRDTDSKAVRLIGPEQTLVNAADGLIETTYRFGVLSRGGQTFELENDGIIRGGDDALRIEQDAVVVNRGTIESLGTYNLHQLGPGATADGITAFASASDGSAFSRLGFKLLNEEGGVITGPRSAVFVSGYVGEIENLGTITGATSGILAQSAESVSITNSGTISQTGNGPTGGNGGTETTPRGAVDGNVDTLNLDNEGVITGADYGVVVSGKSDITNEAGGEIRGTLGAINAFTESDAQVRASVSYPAASELVLPFDPALLGQTQVGVIALPEVAAETGGEYLLPRFEQRTDGKYYEIPGSYPTSYTRPDGSTATVDLASGRILDASGTPLTYFEAADSKDAERLAAGAYNDTLVNAGALKGDVNLGVGDDQFDNTGTIDGAVRLESGNDRYDGPSVTQAVSVDGGAGDDRLTGGAGADTLSGGDGNDTLTGGGGNDRLDGGTGTDEARFAGARAGYTVTLNPDGSLTVADTDATNGNEGSDTLHAVEKVVFADGEFKSGEGTDDDDEIDLSGSGGGTAAGGDGDDLYICDEESDVPVERPGQGIDTVRASLNWTLGPSLEILELTGTDNLKGTGNASPNTLRGNAGNNTLDGAAGSDTLEGGSGNDTYFVDDPNDVVLETTGTTAPGGPPVGLGGRDRSEGEDPTAIGDVADALRSSSPSYALPEGIESATLLDNAGCAALSGNAGANPVTGNAQANLLAGGAGNDSLSGGGGNDVAVFAGVRSGYLVEKLAGGVVRVTDIDPTNGDDGVDRLTGVEALRFADTLEGGLGKGIARGGAAANTLDLSEAGGQIAAGGAGNDVYRVNSTADAAVELADGGRDRVDSSVNWVLWDNVEDLRLTGSNPLTGWGNELGNRMEGNGAANQLKGYAGNDTLFGAAGADRLEGGDGADVLRGGKGNDVLVGGAGADIFLFDAALAGNKESVSDFVSGTDRLQLDNDVFTAFATPGALAATRFAAGANLKAARDADDRIVYDTSTGTLYYDADGKGGTAAVAFAVLAGAPTVTAADFLIAD